MKLIRHLLSHLLLISVIAGICAVYFYRNQILPEKYVQQIDHYAEKIHPRLVTIASKIQLHAGDIPIDVGSDQGKETSEDIVENVAVEKTAPEPAVAEVEHKEQAQDVVADKEKPVAVEPVVAEEPAEADMAMADVPMAEEEKPQAAMNNEVTEQPAIKEETISTVSKNEEESTPDKQQAPATDKETAGADGLLRAARSAFNKGELDVAVTKYNELIELENDEADFYGELGNVHYAMGSWGKAGVAYYEAATRLIETGQLAQVGYLQRVLQGLDAERAEKLTTQMAKVNQGM